MGATVADREVEGQCLEMEARRTVRGQVGKEPVVEKVGMEGATAQAVAMGAEETTGGVTGEEDTAITMAVSLEE